MVGYLLQKNFTHNIGWRRGFCCVSLAKNADNDFSLYNTLMPFSLYIYLISHLAYNKYGCLELNLVIFLHIT